MKNSFALCRLYRCKDGTNISLVLIQQVHGGHPIHSTKLWPDLRRAICWRATDHRKAFDLCVCLPVGHCCVRNASAASGECECDKGNFRACRMQSLRSLLPPECSVAPEPAGWWHFPGLLPTPRGETSKALPMKEGPSICEIQSQVSRVLECLPIAQQHGELLWDGDGAIFSVALQEQGKPHLFFTPHKDLWEMLTWLCLSVKGTTAASALFWHSSLKIQLFTDLSSLSYSKKRVILFCTSGIYSDNLISLVMNKMRCDFHMYIFKLQLPACPSSYRSSASSSYTDLILLWVFIAIFFP